MYWRVHHWNLARASTGAIKAPVPLATNRHSHVIPERPDLFGEGLGEPEGRPAACELTSLLFILCREWEWHIWIQWYGRDWHRMNQGSSLWRYFPILSGYSSSMYWGTWGHGLVVGLAVLCSQLDSMVLRVFCLNDSKWFHGYFWYLTTVVVSGSILVWNDSEAGSEYRIIVLNPLCVHEREK